jgi:uncharacterized protein YcgI (DUF1989 family)
MSMIWSSRARKTIRAPQTSRDDHLDLLAEMNIIAAISACPNSTGPVNNYAAKPLGVKIFDGS